MFYLFHVFRSFIPLRNPIGFGASDFVELFVAATLVLLVLARERLLRLARSFAERTAWCMLALGALTVLLRLALLPQAGAPISSSADDGSYLLLADTLSHFRLANPTHPFYRFFESNFVLQQPSYASIFPLGQGIALALGRAVFGHPWAGVLLEEAALCALCYWMLRGWIPAGWALAGGILAVFQLGPLTYWMNSYWGGAVSGIAGCLVFGALPRLLLLPNAVPVQNAGRDRYRPATVREAVRPSEARVSARPRPRSGVAHPALRMCIPLRDCGTFSAAQLEASGARYPAGRRRDAARGFPHSGAKQGRHRKLDHSSLYVQPIPIRRPHYLHHAAEPGAAPRPHPGTAARLRRAVRNSRSGKRAELLGAASGTHW